jgi:hypothetical protein
MEFELNKDILAFLSSGSEAPLLSDVRKAVNPIFVFGAQIAQRGSVTNPEDLPCGALQPRRCVAVPGNNTRGNASTQRGGYKANANLSRSKIRKSR